MVREAELLMISKNKTHTRIRFLIMEQLPVDGNYVDADCLQQNVSADAHTLGLCYSSHMFDNILMELVQDQYVVNLQGKVIATHMGLVKSNIL